MAETRTRFYKLGLDTWNLLVIYIIFLSIDWICFKLWAVPRATEQTRLFLAAFFLAIYARIDEYTITEVCDGDEETD